MKGQCVRVCEELLKCVQRSKDLRLDLAGGSRLQVARLMHTCQACQKLKRRASCSLQDKSPRLARPFARSLNLRLNPVARSSRQNTLLAKYDFSHSFSPYYIYTLIPTIQRELPERILREKPQRKQDCLIHNLYLKDSSNSSTLFLSIVKSLRDSLSKPFLTISISVRWLFGALESNQEGTNFIFVDAMVKQRNPRSQKKNKFGVTLLEQEAWRAQVHWVDQAWRVY